MVQFEDIVSRLASWAAFQNVSRGLGSLIVSGSQDPYSGRPTISVLNMTWYDRPSQLSVLLTACSDTRHLYNQVRQLKLTANGQSFCQGGVGTVQLVHYKDLYETGEWRAHEDAGLVMHVNVPEATDSALGDRLSRLTFPSKCTVVLQYRPLSS